MTLQEILVQNLGQFLDTLNQVFALAAENTVVWAQQFSEMWLAAYGERTNILLGALDAILPPY